MDKDSIFAVVDMETTGTNPETDNIFQFGCVLIENGQIVSRFATDINPNQLIPKQISHLTGIKNTQVAKAPLFEDVAFTIYNLLNDCVFVAHNVNFDFIFLNEQLKRYGFPELDIEAIDTVELSQIAFPTLSSFRLSDISVQFDLHHNRPHQADSDAEVTAELLLLILKRLSKLPLVTLEQMLPLSELLSMQTGEFISIIYENVKNNTNTLPDDITVIKKIALRKKDVIPFSQFDYRRDAYPTTEIEKKDQFNSHVEFRSGQAKMMDDTYAFFSYSSKKDFAIQADTGIGKTLGYLFPISFLATSEKPCVISTSSLNLQSQLFSKDISILKQLSMNPVRVVVMKSHSHYIDLERFVLTLQEPVMQKQYALYQLAVLVWLTETPTGDIEEMSWLNQTHAFWRDVKHHGTHLLSVVSPFYVEDFVRHRDAIAKESNIIIMNHAFLCRDDKRSTTSLPKNFKLILDEAHRIPEQLQRELADFCDTRRWIKTVSQLSRQLEKEEVKVLSQKLDILTPLSLFFESISLLANLSVDSLSSLFEYLTESGQLSDDCYFTELAKEEFPLNLKKLNRKASIIQNDCLIVSEQCLTKLQEHVETSNLQERNIVVELFQLIADLTSFGEIYLKFLNNWQFGTVKWIEFSYWDSWQGVFYISNLNDLSISSTKWYEQASQILYVSSTLTIGHKSDYFLRQFGLSHCEMSFVESPFDYSQQAQLFVPSEALAPDKDMGNDYIDYLTRSLKQLFRQQKCATLVLFTSHDVLRQVYAKLHTFFMYEGREIIAQGITGSVTKSMRRFASSENAILFGVDAFWEGVDFPGSNAELLVITRLPFESPQRPFVRERYRMIEATGKSSFHSLGIPHVIIRLRQGIGRLIRSDSDNGVVICLDKRLLHAKYSKQLIKALPSGLTPQEVDSNQMLLDINDFFNKKRE